MERPTVSVPAPLLDLTANKSLSLRTFLEVRIRFFHIFSEGEDIGLFITLVPKVYNNIFLFVG